jgi:hypothetical protein
MSALKYPGAAALALVLLFGAPAPANAQQTVNFTLGGFHPFGEDSRVDGDVLVANSRFLTFDVSDFNAATFGGEWLVAAGSFIEFGAGASYYRRTVPTVYRGFIVSDGFEVEQELRLQMVPIALTVRVVPTGMSSSLQPYFGAGLAIVNYRYSEFGDFINFGLPGRPVEPGFFEADGTETGPVVLGGLRFAGDTFSVGGEVRYQKADADLDERFAGSKLDLGGWTYQVTLGLRFGR